MNIKNLSIIVATLLVFFSCSKESDENSTTNIVKAEFIINKIKTSEVDFNTKSNGDKEVEIKLGENYVDTIGNGEELWFSFNANAGELYEISWQDSWWEKYTAGSIYVTGFEEDKKTVYFQKERLLQMNGSPKVISVENNGVVYLKVIGYENEISGSFSIHVDKLDTSNSTKLYCDSTLNFSVSAGEIQLYQMQVLKDSTYSLSIEGSEFIGAYGDEVAVKVTAFREGLNEYYFLDEFAESPVYNSGSANIQSFTALKTEKVYLAVMGAYWWEPRSVSLSLVSQ